jgi:MFS family permease
MKDKRYFERNIKLNYIIGSLMWGRFFIPVLALFYIASQVTLEQFTIIMAVFAFSTLVLEIPTGVIADLLGKKKALLISRAMYVIEIFLVAFFNGFWIFLIAKIISGIGVSFSSGTNSALLYDSLKRLKREDEHKKISGLANTISKVSMAIVFIIGAYLFTINYKLPALASLPLITLGFILTFFLKEPYESKTKVNFTNSLNHLKEGLEFFKSNYYLKYLALFTFLIGSTISIMLSLSSKYFEAVLIPIALIGVVSFVMNLVSAYSSKKAHTLEEKIGEKKSIYLITILTFFSILLLSFVIPYAGLLFFLIIAFVQGFYEVIIGDYVNRHAGSSHRATMLSINNMFDNIGITLLFPLIGHINKAYNLKTSLFTFSIFVLICSLFILLYYKNNKKN